MQNVNILCMIVLLIIGLADAGKFRLFSGELMANAYI